MTFIKGQIPWNKGTKGLIKPNSGNFKKGHKIGVGKKYFLGKKHTEETKRKLSQFHTGLKHTKETLAKISNSLKGKKAWNKGKIGLFKHSKETKKTISMALHGNKASNWKGGITFLTQIIRHCFKYRQWRSDVFTRDYYTCQLCGARGGYLEVDHYPKMFSTIFQENNIKSLDEALTCEEFWNINNGRTLCRGCHNKTKKYGRKNND